MRATTRFSAGPVHALNPDKLQAERLRTTALSARSPTTHSGAHQSYTASPPSGAPTSTSGSTAESLKRAVKSRVAKEIARQAAVPKCPGASPHYRIKPVFNGTRSAFLDYNRRLIQAMELASFDPGPGGLSTTESNITQSKNLRHLILESVTGDAAGMFDTALTSRERASRWWRSSAGSTVPGAKTPCTAPSSSSPA